MNEGPRGSLELPDLLGSMMEPDEFVPASAASTASALCSGVPALGPSACALCCPPGAASSILRRFSLALAPPGRLLTWLAMCLVLGRRWAGRALPQTPCSAACAGAVQVDNFFQSYIEELNSRSKRAHEPGKRGAWAVPKPPWGQKGHLPPARDLFAALLM